MIHSYVRTPAGPGPGRASGVGWWPVWRQWAVGDCWDNAPMESFFHTPKTKRVHTCVYATRDQARKDLFQYIEGFYNPRRLHSALVDRSRRMLPSESHY